ncbi:MAG TPA: polysaccharide deacetylase family protein [Bryobacteraceae bacterium]|nr:polysaccharide deacetylase family protein [Bryobacteraceae bacterium]
MYKILPLALSIFSVSFAQTSPTYAERLGWNKGDRVLILHMDDAGMSHDSNVGIEQVLEKGAARSLSVMMPTPWVPEIVHYIKAHPGTDAGLHLTLTSEWHEYRWGPLAGAPAVPGLVDPEGALWSSVAAVVMHAKTDEVDREMRAQIERAERMGFHPTHLDTHMGTVYAKPEFLERYVELGIEKQIPVMIPGGHDTYIQAGNQSASTLDAVRALGVKLWNAGLPVLDDLHNSSYDWKIPPGIADDDEKLRKWRTERYMETLAELKPGLTMVIMHCTAPTEVFAKISGSGTLRKADMLAMLDPKFQLFLKEQGFVVTTWAEAMERRKRVR